ncbi:Crp/Fnr family transcriptional regulator [Flavicella sediminum]|uniref:Crp/Fnr family transcriptional regulator n=1 Tax=Flavicella sediminum TaxID=2585141 RepID=UPI00111E8E08|nr:Crp/Fnr family transcriptional regulator [Flavicella sediminum]
MDPLHQFMSAISPISEKSFQDYMELCKPKFCKAGTVLSKIGDVPEVLYFIKTGIARSYSISDKGVEYIRSLISPNNILAPTEALIKKQASKIGLQCLTDCDVLEINYKDLLEVNKNNNEIAAWYTKTVELHYAHLQKMNDELLTLNATERYLKLQKRIPNIDNQINQYHIASHLGITPIQLSRIRKKLYSK